MSTTEEARAIRDLVRNIIPNQETVFDVLDEINPDGDTGGRKLTIVQREVQPEPPAEPAIQRADARCHVFYEPVAFCEYLNRFAANIDSVFALADFETGTIVSSLNEQSEIDRETVTLRPQLHPLFEPWANLLDKPMEVLAFANFMVAHRRALGVDGRELAFLFQQITVSKSVTIQRGTGKSAINGVMVQTEISGQKREEAVDLPDTIAITVPMFVGSSEQKIELDLTLYSVGEKVVVQVTAPDVAVRRVEEFERMVQEIANAGISIGMGQYTERTWRIVK